jgi:hypothetical protein
MFQERVKPGDTKRPARPPLAKSTPLCSCWHHHPNRRTRQESPQISLPTSLFHKEVLRDKTRLGRQKASAALIWQARTSEVRHLFLVSSLSHGWGALGFRFGLWLDQDNLTWLDVA